ncbi:O-antigen ligase [Synechococcus sp. N5]|uniref:O-antigen ligase family protein n=1 Tax=Synechococcus sp. N5 TaxID=2575515 RepID=UPI0014822F6A|nr:O-antigen ligase family protein [Synechococcus sp. N5]
MSVYLRDKNNIKCVAMSLVYGTIPVLIIGFSQLIFGFNESLRVFGSFIVWHLFDNGEFTGVFYNRNICAAWLAASFPFFVAAIRAETHSNENTSKSFVASLALFSVSLAMILSNSRNAIGSLIFGTLGMIADIFSVNQSISGFKFSRSSVTLFVIAVVSSFGIYLGLVHPALDALGQFFTDEYRLEIWRFGVLVASKNFLVGSGPGGFIGYVSLLSPFDKPFYHVHSLPLDLWLSYGFVALAVFLVYVFVWLFIAIRSGMLQESLFSKAWVISFLLLIIVHVTDLPYLDARINLVGWILFAGIVSCAESSALASAESSNDAFD